MVVTRRERYFRGDAIEFCEKQLAETGNCDFEVLAQALEEWSPKPISYRLRVYVARILRGEIKRPAHRPKSVITQQEREILDIGLRNAVKNTMVLWDYMARQNGRRPMKYEERKAIALRIYAQEVGMTPAALEQIVWPRAKDGKRPRGKSR